MSDRPTFPVGINVFAIRDGKLLLGRRKGSAGEGMWGLPGGHLESGENMSDAAFRELKEETSLGAQELHFLNLVNDNANNTGHRLQVGFLAQNINGEVQLMEPERCFEWQWFPIGALPENIFFGHSKQIELFLKKIVFSDSVNTKEFEIF
jgi:8-oxo-dGTP diphosphatase